MGECVGVFQGMGDDFAVLLVVIHAAVMRMWVDDCMRVCMSFGCVATVYARA